MPKILKFGNISMTPDVALDVIDYFTKKERKRLAGNRKAQKKFQLKDVIPKR